ALVLSEQVARLEVREEMDQARSEEHTSELQSLPTISYAVFCLKKKKVKFRARRCRKPASDDSSGETEYLPDRLMLFFYNDFAPADIYTVGNTLSLHDALPI